MRGKSYTLTADGVTAPYFVNHYSRNSRIGIGVKINAGGGATYTVQHTFDDPQAAGFNPATATWYNHSVLTALSANNDGQYFAPVRAIRLSATGVSGAGVTITILPGGGGNS